MHFVLARGERGPLPELTVATFNTHWGIDMKARPFDVVGTCLGLEADVLVLQEVWRPHGGTGYVDQIAQATGAEIHEVSFMSDTNQAKPRDLVLPEGPEGTVGLAVVTRLEVRGALAVPLPHARGDVIDKRHGLLVTVIVDGVAITVAGVHASHRPWGSIPQLRCLDRALKDVGTPSMIVGDCNMWGPMITWALPGRSRAVRGRTWPAWRPHSQIDHVWIDNQLQAIDSKIGPAAGSDHLPVRVRLRIN